MSVVRHRHVGPRGFGASRGWRTTTVFAAGRGRVTARRDQRSRRSPPSTALTATPRRTPAAARSGAGAERRAPARSARGHMAVATPFASPPPGTRGRRPPLGRPAPRPGQPPRPLRVLPAPKPGSRTRPLPRPARRRRADASSWAIVPRVASTSARSSGSAARRRSKSASSAPVELAQHVGRDQFRDGSWSLRPPPRSIRAVSPVRGPSASSPSPAGRRMRSAIWLCESPS